MSYRPLMLGGAAAGLLALGSVAAGAAIGLVSSSRHPGFRLLRSFAIAAVLAGVFVELLPEAVDEIGVGAIVAFVAALLLPHWLARAMDKVAGTTRFSHHIGLGLGFYGFVAHQFAEGLALGTYSGEGHAAHGHEGVILAVAVHTVPLTAVFIAASRQLGKQSAVTRSVVLLAFTGAGFLAGNFIGVPLGVIEPWLSAFIAGFLCHVLLHDEGADVPRTVALGIGEVLAVAAGAALPLLTRGHHEGGRAREAVIEAFVDLGLETGPMLLLGLVLGAVLQLFGSRISTAWLNRGGSVRQALRGIAVGAPLPVCACGVLPIAESLRKRGAAPALVMAFLIATPELGPETLTLTVRLLGWPFAIARLTAALLLAFGAAVFFSRVVGRSATGSSPELELALGSDASAPRGWLRRAYGHFDELLLHTAPWTFVGLLTAAYMQAVIPAQSLAPLSRYGVDILVVALVSIPTYVCAASATPIAVILLLKGISPGAVLVGLLLGPATNIATIGVLRRGYGARNVALGIGAVLVIALGLAALLNTLALPVTVPASLASAHAHGVVDWLALGLLLLALAVQLGRMGTQPWFGVIDAGAGGHDHEHGHSHHGHAHHENEHKPQCEPHADAAPADTVVGAPPATTAEKGL